MSYKCLIGIFCLTFFLSCAKERPVRRVPDNPRRIEKSRFRGNFLFLKTLTNVETVAPERRGLIPGVFQETNRLVEFKFHERSLDVVSLDPLFHPDTGAAEDKVLATFTIEKHVDIERELRDDRPTHVEEETTQRNPTERRRFVILEPSDDKKDPNYGDTASANTEKIEIDEATGILKFTILRQLRDGSALRQLYCFQPAGTSPYTPLAYDEAAQERFGYFKTSTFAYDSHGRVTQSQRKDFINRWDLSGNRKVVFHFSKDFPEQWKASVRNSFAAWNTVFRKAIGREPLEVRENSGQESGDLRFNLIHWDRTRTLNEKVLAYVSGFAHPRTGEMIKSDLTFYEHTVRESIFNEVLLRRSRGQRFFADFQAQVGREPSSFLNFYRTVRNANRFQYRTTAAGFRERWENIQRLPSTPNDSIIQRWWEGTPHRMMERAHEHYSTGQAARMTVLDDSFLINLRNLLDRDGLTEEALQEKIVALLSPHELGHLLGLSHNFRASADTQHHHPDFPSSSVMDYGVFDTAKPPGPGPYDEAAVRFAYGSRSTEELLALESENFFFCSDKDAMTSQHGDCLPTDAGRTLREVVASLASRYEASYVLNNVRWDAVHFQEDDPAYDRKIERGLLPLRLIYDYTTSLLAAHNRGDWTALWQLARHRIRADRRTTAAHRLSIRVPTAFQAPSPTANTTAATVEQVVDRSKVTALLADARLARESASIALIEVVESDERRSYAWTDPIRRQVTVRGVLRDKIIALQLILGITPDPSRSDSRLQLFPATPQSMSFISDLLSNTVEVVYDRRPDHGRREPGNFDINLRLLALRLLQDQLRNTGPSGQLHQMFVMERVPLNMANVTTRLRIESDLRRYTSLRDRLELPPQIVAILRNYQANQRNHLILEIGSMALSHGPGMMTPALPFLSLLPRGSTEWLTYEQRLIELNKEMEPILARETPDHLAAYAIEPYRTEARNAFRALLRTRPIDADDEDLRVGLLLRAYRQRQDSRTLAFAYAQHLGLQHFKAPIRIEGNQTETITGKFLRDNMNVLEDVLRIYQGFLFESQGLIGIPALVVQSNTVPLGMPSYAILANEVSERLNLEKIFAERLYQIFELRR